jgi:battenin
VNIYYYIVHEDAPKPSDNSEGGWSQARLLEWQKQAKEFRIGSMGFADSFGILLASLIAMPTEIALCKTQVQHGKVLCKQL